MVTTDKVSYYHMLKLETMPQKKKKKKKNHEIEI